MRELPEIEVLRRELERELAGRIIASVDAQVPASVTRKQSKKAFSDQLEGAKVESVSRRALLLLFGLDGERILVVRLGQTGAFRKTAGTDAAGVTFTFTQGTPLYLVDLGKDAEVFVVAADELGAALPELATFGFDPLDQPMTWPRFSDLVSRRHEPMKRLLLDSTFMCGLGDVYVDEILFEAGIRHDRKCDSLSSQEVRRLYRSLIEVLHDAVKHRGAHIGEHGICDLLGKPGEHQEHLQVHGREGKLSPRSRTPIKKIKYDGHLTFYCDTQV